ncbi:MAG: Hsp20/alpha crystallin family protein [Lachnospiraceae bacterium]|nr:Hsp20/alpha crystallin family protein [Lachnospiraceae bacterium]
MLMPGIFGENLFDEFFGYPKHFIPEEPKHAPQKGGLMKTDVKENKDGFDLFIELPGYNKGDIEAEISDGYLTISAKTASNKEEKDEDGKYIRRERYTGSCKRTFYVGEDITEEDIKAKFENGILKLNVPKKEAKPKVEEKKFISIEG